MGYLFGLAGSLLGTLVVAFIFILAVMHWQVILQIVLVVAIGWGFERWRKHVRWVKPIQPYHTDIFLRGTDLEKRLVRQLAWLGYANIRPNSRCKLSFTAELRGYRLGFNCCGELTLTEMQKNARALTSLYLDQVIIATTHPISAELRAAARQLDVTLWDHHRLAELPLTLPTTHDDGY
ncbi:hypothetical protein LZY01_21120 [Levilactobacillus zymae]|uniref:Restriction endonuclease type IV Mrr domain-containing protein n=1 Tax=Levilactobacillus zymae TaxID=267363 RepID=A0ABQ0WYE6_9LACO|nr:hypothetical protein [Levilactobacillus zymae]KRL16462.1 hypothetical protein FD38_GL002105 [Levilactobacillus zymae DSM 19395]QFR60561.1 hypothetical protein LZ395_03040 [Levilactobacillus zymae]GEO72944.1 hypothetical protein LZY01_21120 [Levilactobacillus zymae]